MLHKPKQEQELTWDKCVNKAYNTDDGKWRKEARGRQRQGRRGNSSHVAPSMAQGRGAMTIDEKKERRYMCI